MHTELNSHWRTAILGLIFLLPFAAGCLDMSQQEYDQAVRRVSVEQERLDNLRPAYDAARQEAMQVVVKELSGTTPQEADKAALEQLNTIAENAKKTPPAGEKKRDDLDQAVDLAVGQLTAMQNAIESMQKVAGTSNPATEMMTKIKTPGTPENKRWEEVLAAMPEVQAYERQKTRLAEASAAVLEAEAELPDAAKRSAAVAK